MKSRYPSETLRIMFIKKNADVGQHSDFQNSNGRYRVDRLSDRGTLQRGQTQSNTNTSCWRLPFEKKTILACTGAGFEHRIVAVHVYVRHVRLQLRLRRRLRLCLSLRLRVCLCRYLRLRLCLRPRLQLEHDKIALWNANMTCVHVFAKRTGECPNPCVATSKSDEAPIHRRDS